MTSTATAAAATAAVAHYTSTALSFKVLAECSVSKARTGFMTLPHGIVETPVFMPVGTQVTY